MAEIICSVLIAAVIACRWIEAIKKAASTHNADGRHHRR